MNGRTLLCSILATGVTAWRRRRVPAAAPILAVGAIFALAACGGGGEARPQSLPGSAEQLLTESDVDRYAQGTPERALLEWWRSAQYANLSRYLDSFELTLRKRLADAPNTEMVLDYFAGLIRTARPKIKSVERDGARATLYTILEYRIPVGTEHYATSTRPQAFTMLRQRGEWRLVDHLYLEQSVAAVRRSQEEK